MRETLTRTTTAPPVHPYCGYTEARASEWVGILQVNRTPAIDLALDGQARADSCSHPQTAYMLLTETMICHACKAELKIEGYISRSDDCPHCGTDIHCCLNCTNYDPHAHNKCREPQAEWVTDREKGNFCDFFLPNKLSPGAATSPASDPRSAFDNLFKK